MHGEKSLMDQRSILIVEDESLIAQDIRYCLENLGYVIKGIVATGEEAIQKARDLRPGVILMDIMLKGKVDGIEAAKEIWSELNIPVIFLTAHSDDAIVNRAKAAQPYGYLLKPFKERELNVMLEMSFQRYDLEQRLREQERKLRESEERFRTIFEASPIGIELYDRTGKLLAVNEACLEIFGVASGDEMREVNLFADTSIPDEIKDRLLQGEIVQYDTLFDFDKAKDYNFLTSKTGTSYLEVLITPIGEQKEQLIDGFLVQVQDVSERKRDEMLLRELSLVDELTSLYNRRGFMTLAQKSISAADRMQRGMFLIFLDLDNLKSINDSLSHREGDIALISTAEILNETFRSSDIIGRWGGDEFIVLMVNSENMNEQIIEGRLRQNLDKMNQGGTLKFDLSLSWGIVRYQPRSMSLEELIIRADRLMYQHKRSTKKRSTT